MRTHKTRQTAHHYDATPTADDMNIDPPDGDLPDDGVFPEDADGGPVPLKGAHTEYHPIIDGLFLLLYTHMY